VGTDTYEIALKNQWVFDSLTLLKYEDDKAYVILGDQDLPEGQSYWRPGIPWRVPPNGSVFYSAFVTIVGPKGIPDK